MISEDAKQKNVLFFNWFVIFVVLMLIGLLHMLIRDIDANFLLPQENNLFQFLDKLFLGDVIGVSLSIIGMIGMLVIYHFWSRYVKFLKKL